MIRESIQKLVDGLSLTREEAQETMREIMSGGTTEAQIAAFLTALRMKGETVEEITAFAEVMKDFCCRINPKVDGRLVDTCGTGGDKLKTFNISTTAAFVVAGSGIAVAKHGNRSVTSKSGSADLLERLGLNLNQDPNDVERAIQEVGIGFMFAPAFHPAMKYAMGARKTIGIRTVFNLLGPLTNPAGASAQILGVYDAALLETLAHVLNNLGCKEAMVVHGLDGLDEISTIGKTRMAWVRDGKVAVSEKMSKDFGIKTAEFKEIAGTTPEESAKITFRILNGAKGPKRDIVVVNAAAGIIVGGKAEDFHCGIELANKSLDSGAAYEKLRALIKAFNGSLSKLEELESKYG